MALRKEDSCTNRTVENIEALLRTAHAAGVPVFVSPHYCYPSDDSWLFREPLGEVMHENHRFTRKDPLSQ